MATVVKNKNAGPSTEEVIAAAADVLKLYKPMTVRQVYCQLVATNAIENKLSQYKKVGTALVKARRFRQILWSWIEDRLRQPFDVNGPDEMRTYLQSVPHMYRRGVWQDQPAYVELWLEKDALSGVFRAACWKYRVTLNVGRGYDGWSSLYAAAQRYKALPSDKPVTILYFGDWDPSGLHITESLEERLGDLGVFPTIRRIAITEDDIATYHLPTAPAKPTDSRTARFEEEHGEGCVELDALPPPVLAAKIDAAIAEEMDLGLLERSMAKEKRLRKWLDGEMGLLPLRMPEGDRLGDDGEPDPDRRRDQWQDDWDARYDTAMRLQPYDRKTLARLERLAPWIARMNGDDLHLLYNASCDVQDIMYDNADRDRDRDYADSRPDYLGEEYDPDKWEGDEDEDDEDSD